MAQSSAPISQGTIAERQFKDTDWRDRFGDEPGVLGDRDGTAYAVTLAADSDIATIGSGTQASLATVAGFLHRIPQSSPEPITIPAAVGSARTDIIALRYDPAYTGLPGPVRLLRIPGTAASVPAYDAAPPGIEDLPLWSITRQPGASLSQATVTRMFPRIAPALGLAESAPLPLNSPLDTIVRQGAARYVRALGPSGVPRWEPAQDVSATGRAPITVTGKVENTTALMSAVRVPSVAVPYRVTFAAMGRGGFDATARELAWDWDTLPAQATNVQRDTVDRVHAGAADWTAVVSTLSYEMPARVAATARLILRSDGPVYSRGGVIWTRGPIV